MPERLLMLDSGAWTAWAKGKKIDLEAYARFCLDHPGVDYFVSLDVIPGSPGRKASRELEGGFLTGAWALNEDAEKSCRESWHNYRELVKALPPEKVIPVYHYGDDARWLKKYLDHGCEYVGIGGLVGRGRHDRTRFMASLRPYLLDGKGRPRVKTHGFGLTSFAAMKCWPWYSVDSTSWSHCASFGAIYVPRRRGGAWDYSLAPFVVAVSPVSPKVNERQSHVQNLSPSLAGLVRDYLGHMNVPLGEYKVHDRSAGHKLKKGVEVWFDRARGKVLEKVTMGAATDHKIRRVLNARFVQEAEKVLPPRHIYFALSPRTDERSMEDAILTKRLISYWDLEGESTGSYRIYQMHLKRVAAAGRGVPA